MATPPNMYKLAVASTSGVKPEALTQEEQDLLNLNPAQLHYKYGQSKADQLLQAYSGALQDTYLDLSNDASTLSRIGDFGLNVGIGGVNTIGGLGALGASAFSPEFGQEMARSTQELSASIGKFQSENAQDKARYYGARGQILKENNRAQYERDIANGSSTMRAGLNRIGRDIVDSIENATQSSETLTAGTGQGVGSLLGGVGIAATLRKIGSAVLGTEVALTGRAAGAASGDILGGLGSGAVNLTSKELALSLGRYGANAAVWPTAVGLMEAGGAYSGTVNEAAQVPLEVLRQQDTYKQNFDAFLAEGLSPTEADREAITTTIQEAGTSAALKQGVVGAGIGMIAPWAATPFATTGLKNTASNIFLREPIEEALQGGSSQYYQNRALQQNIDNSRDMLEGVGEQIGTGALYGLTSTGTIQGPSLAVQSALATADTVGAGVETVASAFGNRGERVISDIEATSPVSNEAVSAKIQAAKAEIPQVYANVAATTVPEEKSNVDDVFSSIEQALTFSDKDIQELDPTLQASLVGSKDRIEVIDRLLTETNNTDPEKFEAAMLALATVLQPIREIQNKDISSITGSMDEKAASFVHGVKNTFNEILQTPTARLALDVLDQANQQQLNQSAELTVDDLATPAGQAKARGMAALAAERPDIGNIKSINTILNHADDGLIDLTKSQIASLKVSRAIIDAKAKLLAEREATGNKSVKDVVTEEIVSNESGKKQESHPSALIHARRIVDAYRSGDFDLTAKLMEDFGFFVDHMTNKANAFKTHYANGSPKRKQEYLALMPNRALDEIPVWKGAEAYVNTGSVKSVGVAQAAMTEQRILAQVFNGLVDAFPDMGQKKREEVAIPSSLEGSPESIVAAHAKGMPDPRVNQTAPVEAVVEPVAQTQVAPETEQAVPEPAPVNTVPQNILDRITRMSVEQLEAGITRFNKRIDSRKQAKEPEDANEQAILSALQEELSKKQITEVLEEVEQTTTETAPEPVATTPVVETQVEAETKTEVEAKAETETKAEEEVIAPVDEVAETNSTSEEQKEDVEQTEPTQPDILTGIKSVFTGLVEHTTNYFYKAFSLRNTKNEQAPTRIFGEESPLAYVRDILLNEAEFANETGRDRVIDSKLSNAFSRLLDIRQTLGRQTAGGILAQLEKQLSAALGSKNKEGITVAERWETGTEANRWTSGKILNIAQKNADGSYSYHPALIESAVLAGMSWFMQAKNIQNMDMDDTQLADLFGVAVEGITDDMRVFVSLGNNVASTKLMLAAKIKQYWGLQSNSNIPDAYTEGIPEAVAGEILEAMEALGMILEQKFDGDVRKEVTNIIVNTELSEPVAAFPSAIDKLVLVNPEQEYTFNQDMPYVPKVQHNNGGVPLTKKQLKATRRASRAIYKINMPMLNIYLGLSRDVFIEAFGHGKLNPFTTNKNHFISLEGYNSQVANTFDAIQTLSMEINAVSGHARKFKDVTMRFGHTITRTGRMMMLGAFNPQANKTMREMVLASESTLDLVNNVDDITSYNIALGQAFGIKVHFQSPSKTELEVSVLSVKLQPAIEIIQKWLSENNTEDNNPFTQSTSALDVLAVKQIMVEAGITFNALSLHAVMDMARFTNATTQERQNFTTKLYVEADGVTNGPFNAIQLYSTGYFTKHYIKMSKKGGLSIGSKKSLAELNIERDTYTENSNFTSDLIKKLALSVSKQKSKYYTLPQINALLSVMNLLSKDVTYDPKSGVLELKRGISKNPLTVFVYGASPTGIAGAITNMLKDALYERLSQEAQGIPFPEKEQFIRELNLLTNRVFKNERRGAYTEAVKQPTWITDMDPVTFTLTASQSKALMENVRSIFVNPMVDSIEQIMGHDVLSGVKLIQQATNIQSALYATLYKEQIEVTMMLKSEEDADYQPSDYISRDDRKEIEESLSYIAPLVRSEEQTLYMAKSEQNPDSAPRYSRTLSERFRQTSVKLPAPIGVGGIPGITIGYGDALAVLHASENLIGDNVTYIYDGMNLPLSYARYYSEQLNEAVFASITSNPYKDLAATFQAVADNMDDVNRILAKEDAELQELPVTASFAKKREVAPLTMALNETSVSEVLSGLKDRAKKKDARNNALKQVPVSVDQLAAMGSPAFMPGKAEIEPSESTFTDDESVALLNSFMGAPVEEVESVKGITQYSWQDLLSMPKKLRFTKAQRLMFDLVMKTAGIRDYKIVTGSVKDLQQYQLKNGYTVTDFTKGTKGTTSIGDKVIYLVSDKSETLTHELIHAATFHTVYAHYMNASLDVVSIGAIRAIEAIEGLMNEFLGMDHTDNSSANRLASLINRTLLEGTPESKAVALNEFMAWALTNTKITSKLKKTPVLARIHEMGLAVVEYIKRMFSAPSLPKLEADFLSNLQFHTAILLQEAPTYSSVVEAVGVLNHSVDEPNLVQLRTVFDRKITAHLKQTLTPLEAPLAKKSLMLKSMQHALDVANVFNMSVLEKGTFSSIVAALSTQAEIDPTFLAKIQELYSHVLKGLDQTAFVDPNSEHQDLGIMKYNIITGRTYRKMDAYGRSSILPTFLALALTNKEFKEVLSKIKPPKTKKNEDGTFNALLENLGNTGLDKMSEFLVREGNPSSVLEAINTMTETLVQRAVNEKTLVAEVLDRVGGAVEATNDWMVSGMNTLSDKGMKIGESLTRSSSKTKQAMGALIRVSSALATEKNSEMVAESFMSLMNKQNVPTALYDFLNGVIGRTSDNASIYDLIKVTRSAVQRIRQQFRDLTPQIIKGKFQNKLTDEQSGVTFRSIAKTDIAALADGRSVKSTLAMLNDQTLVDAEIASLEEQLQKLSPKNFKQYQRKMQQLARYMNTGKTGHKLLRNAHTIARLFGEGKAVVTGVDQITKVIDQLTSLYAFNGLSQKDKGNLRQLVQKEPEGMEFLLSYLVGQRKGELSKSRDDRGFINHYKGYIPSSQEEGVSLRVVNDSQYTTMVLQGYTRVGTYNGSLADDGKGSMGYYFSSVSAKTAVSQGIAQNVQHTFSGVDATNGFSIDGITAGFIVNPVDVRSIQQNMDSEKNQDNENLMPLYDASGKVFAYERSIDPAQLARLQKSQKLPEMIGVWRGRQIEEVYSTQKNKVLVERLHSQWEKDKNKGRGLEYVNLFDSSKLTSVQRGAVALFSESLKDQISEVFPENEFWVRKDQIEDVIGYRNASITGSITGNSNLSPEQQKVMKNILLGIFGKEAFRKLISSERFVQAAVQDARNTIIVKSIIVLMNNIIGNVIHLVSVGVPMIVIATQMPRKLYELNFYNKGRLRQIEIEAEVRATEDPSEISRLKAESRSITDSHERLSIWPLLEAGEFSAISDVGVHAEDTDLFSGKFMQWIEGKVDKLPNIAKTLAKYGIVTRDTALFRGLHLSVQYGDFLAKAILYDHLRGKKGKTQEEALGRITEEFVNYDRLPSRNRAYLESVGLMWFYSYKIRIAKVGLSTIRNNPLRALLMSFIPLPSGVGTPMSDNIFAQGLSDGLDYSLGPGMLFNSITLNPWLNIVD